MIKGRTRARPMAGGVARSRDGGARAGAPRWSAGGTRARERWEGRFQLSCGKAR